MPYDVGFFEEAKSKEITLQQLRDLVVLKRNDVRDATHVGSVAESQRGYLTSDNVEYFWNYFFNKWNRLSNLTFKYQQLEPIEKKEMKEFLVNHNNTWTLQLLDADTEENSFRVAVPEGANVAFSPDLERVVFKRSQCGYSNASIIWQRPQQPEELPFVDDEPKDNVNNPSHYADSSIECIDAMEAMMTPEQFIGYLRGNVFKHQWRYEKKNGLEDLKKAQWYLEKLTIKVAEKDAFF